MRANAVASYRTPKSGSQACPPEADLPAASRDSDLLYCRVFRQWADFQLLLRFGTRPTITPPLSPPGTGGEIGEKPGHSANRRVFNASSL